MVIYTPNYTQVKVIYAQMAFPLASLTHESHKGKIGCKKINCTTLLLCTDISFSFEFAIRRRAHQKTCKVYK